MGFNGRQYLRQVFKLDRLFPRQPVLFKILSQVLSPVCKHCSAFLSEIRPAKTLFSNLSSFLAKRPVSEPVF